MEKNVGERIKELRQKAGLTQAELAEKVGFTSQTVSNWEAGNREPDIAALTQLAQLFNVTLDYLLLGKEDEEKITLDDMDDDKRALLIIKKDNVANFEKYGYLKPDLLFVQPYYGREDRKTLKIVEAIYENKSSKIFKMCLLKALGTNSVADTIKSNGALAVRYDLDKYIRMCVMSDCVDGLKAINFKYFAISSRTSATEPVSFHIAPNLNPPYEGYKTPSVSLETFNYIFSLKDLSKDMLDYLTDVEFYNGGNQVYLMGEMVLKELYAHKLFDRLHHNLEEMEKYNVQTKEKYNESLNGSWYTGKRIKGHCIYFLNYDNSYLKALIMTADTAMTLAHDNKDVEWIKIFNDYNKKIKELFPDMENVWVLKDKDIKVIEMETNDSGSVIDILVVKSTENGILNYKGMLSSDYGLDKEDRVALYKEAIKRVKTLKPIILSSSINAFELMHRCVEENRMKELFQFATDLQCPKLENLVIEGDKKGIKQLANNLFVPEENYFKEYETSLRRVENIHVNGPFSEDVEATERACQKERDNIRFELEKKIVADKSRKFKDEVDVEVYDSLLKRQFHAIPFGDFYKTMSLETLQKEKERAIQETLELYEDKLEKLTGRLALERDYKRISEELNHDYLLSELNKGEADKVVVLICKRLQIILEYKHGYEGDLFTMIDRLIDSTMRLHNCTDDEDNNYYRYQEEDKIFSQRIQLLHKLRMKRNNIVHAERKDVEMSIDEIRDCIELIETLSK